MAEKSDISAELGQYHPLRDTLSVQDGVIFKGEAIVIPKSLRKEMLQRLHKAHLGYDSMDRRARGTIFWPGMRAELKEFTKKCVQCEDRKPPPQQEKLKQHSDGLRPWDKVGSDLFQIQNRLYLVVVDYHSSFIEVDFLTAATSQQVIDKMKKHFARFGIPRELITDGGPQYMSTEFCNFTQKWGIKHHITSPHHSASNGKAESAVKAMKTLIIKCHESRTDPMEAILEQRNTPRADTKRSPAEMMMNRKLRTMVPSRVKAEPSCESRVNRKKSVKKWFDQKAHDQPKVKIGQSVYFHKQSKKPWQKGIVENINGDRYIVRSEESGLYARNRVHIRPTKVEVQIREQSPPRYGDMNSETRNQSAPKTHETTRMTATSSAGNTTAASESEPTAASESGPSRYNLRPRGNIQRPQCLEGFV